MIKVLHDRVLVRRLEDGPGPGLIHLPDTARSQRGEVVTVGNGARAKDGTLRAPALKPGDQIVFGKYVGNDVKIDGAEYIIMRESEVYGVLGQ